MFSSCQKSSDKPNADKNSLLDKTGVDGQAIIPDNVCSDHFKKLALAYSDNEKHIITLRESIKNRKDDSSLNNQYKNRTEQQVENCKAIEDRFKKESITGCLKKAGTKNKSNTIFANDFTNLCKAVGLRAKIATKKENQYTLLNAHSIASLKFSESAKELIQPANKSDMTFIVNKEIKFGKENFMRSAQAGIPTCYMTSYPGTTLPDDLTFKYVADDNDSKQSTELGFEFSGTRSLIAIEADSMYSMLCLNLKLSLEKDKKSVLEKIFGDQIQVIERNMEPKKENEAPSTDIATNKLNSEVAPMTITPVSEINPNSKPAKENGQAPLIPATLNTQLAQGLTTVGTEVNRVADHVVDKVSNEASKTLEHAEAVGTALVEKTKIAAKEVAQQAIIDAKKQAVEGIKDLIKAPFIAVGSALVETGKAILHPINTYHKVSAWLNSTFSSDDEKPKQAEVKK